MKFLSVSHSLFSSFYLSCMSVCLSLSLFCVYLTLLVYCVVVSISRIYPLSFCPPFSLVSLSLSSSFYKSVCLSVYGQKLTCVFSLLYLFMYIFACLLACSLTCLPASLSLFPSPSIFVFPQSPPPPLLKKMKEKSYLGTTRERN